MSALLKPNEGADHSFQAALGPVDKLISENQHAQALSVLLPILKAGVLEAAVLDRAASCYFQLGDSKTAISLLEVITQTWPDLMLGWGKLAAMRQTNGDKDGAIECYRRALKIEPNSVNALTALNLLTPFTRDSRNAERLRKQTKKPKLDARELAMAHNALGRIEQRADKHRIAFRHFSKAKEATRVDFDLALITAKVDEQVRCFETVEKRELSGEEPRMIFVCGMPRSGTTLVENILLRHSDVESVGESPALTQTLQAVNQHMLRTGKGAKMWDWFGNLTAEEISAFRQYYYKVALANRPAKNPVIVDKMPLNSFELGLAHVLFPDAKFIFMSRHPLDVGLSNFSTNFYVGNEFSRRLDWIGEMTKSVYRSIHDYEFKLIDQLRLQSYAAMVTDPESQISALLTHLQLPWQDACMTPERSGGTVRTASFLQVREKINTNALGKWKPYEAELEPLVQALGGQEWIDDWQRRDDALAAVS